MTVLAALDATAVRRWAGTAVASLDEHRAEIDRLNVFPVHDSDTGTNLAITLRAAAEALAGDAADDPAAALQALARGAVFGARGNSGNIVAQLLRALADAVAAAGRCDATALREGLRQGAMQARAAVADPVEGTILTVAAAAAAAVPDGDISLAEVAGIALAAADEALRRTPDQLAVLARAGVVDAGAQGWVLLLEALVRTIGGDLPEITPVAAGPSHPHHAQTAGTATAGTATADGPAAAGTTDHGIGGALEVQYLLDTAADFGEEAAAGLRAELARLGESVVVVGTGEGTWSVHVHTDDAGAALEAGLAAGRPYRISVTQLAGPGIPPKPGAVVAVAPGEGLARLFAHEGVHVVGSADPSVADLVTAILDTTAFEVVLLPGTRVVARTAESAAEQVRSRGVRVAIVPTRSPVQALAAVAVHDPGRRFDDDVIAMAEAAAATRFAELTVAEHEALTAVGVCQAGDMLGLIDGEVVEIGRSALAVALAVVDRLLGVGAELITILVGTDARPGLGAVVERHVRDRSALTEVSVYEVAQLHVPLIIGVE